MTPPPTDWLKRLPQPPGRITLDVAGHETPVLLTHEALEAVYLPLLADLEMRSRSHRVVAGLAGIPGSGKSTVAAVLVDLADRLLGPGAFAACGIDGWHLPNSILDTRRTLDPGGQPIPLRRRKGSPESFDVPAIAEAIRALRADDRDLSLPVYDRRIHDPRPDALIVPRQTRIILIEGNYLLDDQPPWEAVARQLAPTFFLACDPDLARRRVIDRHVRGGCSPEQAEHKYAENDGPNARLVLQHIARADWIIQLDRCPSLRKP